MADRDETIHVDNEEAMTDTTVDETAAPIEATAEEDLATPARKPRPRKPKAVAAEPGADGERPAKKRAPRRKKPAKPSLALPVVITDETVLLPHMSIPYPVEDDETARAIDRAMRMNPRLVLVLTERRVERSEGDDAISSQPERDLIDMMTDLIAEQAVSDDFEYGVPGPASQSGDEPWEALPDDDQAQYELCQVGVIAEVGQYISRPGGQDHVILQGITRGVAEELIQDQPFVAARVRREDDVVADPSQTEAAMAAVLEQIESYI